jgi:5'-nucleotidase
VTGTPADCVKIACQRLLPRMPDAVVSGINHGPNTAVNVIYSGTVSAATEAAILGIRSVAISHCTWGRGADMGPASEWARRIVRDVLDNGLPAGVLLNVNIPEGTRDEILGAEITRQARARWEEEFEERLDPTQAPYYWLGGRFVNLDEGRDTDLDAVSRGYVSITPLHYDLTAYAHISDLQTRTWE